MGSTLCEYNTSQPLNSMSMFSDDHSSCSTPGPVST